MPEINVIGILSGGLSAIDTALSGDGDVVESFFTGYGLGVAGASFMFGVTAIPAIMLEVKMLLAVVQSVSIGFGLHFAGEAWDDGNVPLAVFRTAMVTVDMATFYMQFGPEIANGWKYYFGNAGGQSAGGSGNFGFYQDANGRWHRPNGQFASNEEVGIISNNKIASLSHGNSLSDPRTNYGYVLVDRETNGILKFGETIHPTTRYSQNYLDTNNANMIILEQGSKLDIHLWQHDMNEYYFNKYNEYPSLNSGGW